MPGFRRPWRIPRRPLFEGEHRPGTALFAHPFPADLQRARLNYRARKRREPGEPKNAFHWIMDLLTLGGARENRRVQDLLAMQEQGKQAEAQARQQRAAQVGEQMMAPEQHAEWDRQAAMRGKARRASYGRSGRPPE